jgi:hypothetical protein
MIRHRNILIVRHQRIFRPVDPARCFRVMNTCEEVGEVANPSGQMQGAVGGVVDEATRDPLNCVRLVGIQDLTDPAP